jgi:hypothetical protein
VVRQRVRRLHQRPGVNTEPTDWAREREQLLGRRISELGLRVAGSPLEPLVTQLYAELDARGLVFQPPVYLSDEWGCPSDVPIIGVPFYLADRRLARIEAEQALDLEGETDAMKFLRHEAGHAYNYAYRLYDRADWRELFGPYSRPYRERYHVDPLSRDHVRHILGWYAQKHPDEDFAESFAVWLTPGEDWRHTYAGWPALRKLEYVDRVVPEVGRHPPPASAVGPEHVPVETMHYTVAEFYGEAKRHLQIGDERYFDGDLRTLFSGGAAGEAAATFLRGHQSELVRRISYWTGEPAGLVRAFLDFLTTRAEALELRVGAREASTLIELTAFGTAVLLNYRHTQSLVGREPGA